MEKKIHKITLTNCKSGFTLLEILLVVAAIAILAGIVILAINPVKQLGDTRNTQRRSDVSALLNAVYQYSIDNNGNFPTLLDGITGSSQVLGTDGSGCDTTCTAATTTVTGCVDFTSDLVDEYIVAIPFDPTTGSSVNTDYYINQISTGRILIGSCDPEQDVTIQITR